jgi:hypothetical protein
VAAYHDVVVPGVLQEDLSLRAGLQGRVSPGVFQPVEVRLGVEVAVEVDDQGGFVVESEVFGISVRLLA